MHPATRALSWKNASEAQRQRELLERAARDAAILTAADAAAPRPATKSTAPIRVASFRC